MIPRIALLVLAIGASLLSQTKTGQAKSWTPLKTPWGDPDLQGMWPGNMGVPLQRPESLGTRATLTDEEFAKREA